MRVFFGLAAFAIVVVAFFVAIPASAQSARPASTLGAALEAQYRAAIIRERRLADDRTLTFVNDAEARMRAARQVLVATQSDRARAQIALSEARAEFVRLVEAVPVHDAAQRVALEAFRAEVEGRLPDATPELLEAYRAFADSDRTAAWSTLEPLLRARAVARVAAARAVAASEIRELATLRGIMRINGEAGIADEILLWDEASELEPNHVATHVTRAALSQQLNDLPRAQRAVDAALRALEHSPRDTWAVYREAASIARASGAHINAEQYARRARAAAIEAMQDNPGYLVVAISQSRQLGELLVEAGRFDDAEESFLEMVRAIQPFASHFENDPYTLREVALMMESIVEIEEQRSQVNAAVNASEVALEIFRRVETLQSDVQSRLDVASAASELARQLLQSGRGDRRALSLAQEAVQALRAITSFDSANLNPQFSLATALDTLGDIELGRAARREAASAYEESYAIRSRLLAGDDSNIDLVEAVSVSLAKRARLTEDRAEALALYDQGIVLLRPWVVRVPGDVSLQESLRSSLQLSATVARELGLIDSARSRLREAVATARRIADLSPASVEAHSMAALAMAGLALDGGMAWSDVRAYVADIDQRGLFDREAYRVVIDSARDGESRDGTVDADQNFLRDGAQRRDNSKRYLEKRAASQ